MKELHLTYLPHFDRFSMLLVFFVFVCLFLPVSPFYTHPHPHPHLTGFIRKVYLTLMMQLLFTVGIICCFLSWWGTKCTWYFLQTTRQIHIRKSVHLKCSLATFRSIRVVVLQLPTCRDEYVTIMDLVVIHSGTKKKEDRVLTCSSSLKPLLVLHNR